MKMNGKQLLPLLLALVLCLSLLPTVSAEEIKIIEPEEPALIDIIEPLESKEPEPEAELQATRTLVDSGPCGDDLTWKFFSDGEMVIFGEGDMWDEEYSEWEGDYESYQNWWKYNKDTNKITIKSGVTGIGSFAFDHFNAKEVSLPSSLKTIGKCAFRYCQNLRQITIPSGVTDIMGASFSNCSNLNAVVFKGNFPQMHTTYLWFDGDDVVDDDVNPFYKTTAMAVYPDGNSSYSGNMQNYGGKLTWVSSTQAAAKKPIATLDPVDQKTKAHNTVNFKAHGIGLDVSYQWQCRVSPDRGWFDADLEGAQTSTLTVTSEAKREGYQYRCKISNGNGSAYTQPATLSVLPVIDQQPTRLRVPSGETAVFRVEVSGPDLLYQWQYLTPEGTSWVNCTSEGNKTAELKIPSKFSRDQFLFRCKITSTHGKVTSKYAELRVTPGVTTQPKDASCYVGDSASFRVKASGADRYQWQYREKNSSSWYVITSSDYSGTDTDTLYVPVTVKRDGMQYRCKLTNEGGSTYTDTVTLHVKPTVTAQPANRSIYPGNNAKFTVTAVGANPSYQWQYFDSASGKWYVLRNGSGQTDYKGCSTKTLTVPAKSSRNGIQYRCKISNSFGVSYSTPAVLTVCAVTQPKDASCYVGDTASFCVKASETDSYQWQYYSQSQGVWYVVTSSDYSGMNTDTLRVPVTAARDGMQYRCKLKNSDDTTYTKTVTLHVKPTVTAQPANRSIYPGNNAKFTVTAVGANPSYQWQYFDSASGKWYVLRNGSGQTDYKGCSTKTLTVPAKSSRNGIQYRCKISNSFGVSYSTPAVLTVCAVTQPKDASCYVGDTASFCVKASETDSYQWQYYSQSQGVWYVVTSSDYSGMNTDTLRVPVTAARDGMQYRCKLKNSDDTTYTKTVTLHVKPTITSQPVDRSTSYAGASYFAVKASGPNLQYQWQYLGASTGKWYNLSEGNSYNGDFSGTTGNRLRVPGKLSRDGMQFRCRIRNDYGTVYTNTVSLSVSSTMNKAPLAEFDKRPADFMDVAEFYSIQLYLNLELSEFDVINLQKYEWQYYDTSSGSWKKQPGDAYDGGGGCTLNLPYEAKYHGRQFRLKMTSQYGVGYSKPLTLKLDPIITTQPATTVINPGESFTVSVKASGSNLKYQWYWAPYDSHEYYILDGKTSSSLTVKTKTIDDAQKSYLCVVTGANGSVLSEAVYPKIKRAILNQPKSTTVQYGKKAEFTIRAEGNDELLELGVLHYGWQYYDSSAKKWVDIPYGDGTKYTVQHLYSSCESVLTVNSGKLGDLSSLSIRCRVFCNGTVVNTSNTAKLTIQR